MICRSFGPNPRSSAHSHLLKQTRLSEETNSSWIKANQTGLLWMHPMFPLTVISWPLSLLIRNLIWQNGDPKVKLQQLLHKQQRTVSFWVVGGVFPVSVWAGLGSVWGWKGFFFFNFHVPGGNNVCGRSGGRRSSYRSGVCLVKTHYPGYYCGTNPRGQPLMKILMTLQPQI